MKRIEVQFAKRLQELENEFLGRYRQYLERVIHLPHAYSASQVAEIQLPLRGMLAKLLAGYVEDIYAAGRAHGSIFCREMHKKYAPVKLADWQPPHVLAGIEYDLNSFWLKPEAAIKALEARSILLAGDVDGDILAGVKQVLLQHLQGVPRADTEIALTALLAKNENRARLITTTETTYAYNRGRLSSFYADGVDYVQFSAVLDRRTSPQCRSREGKVMRIDNPELPANTPPLHGRCRSILSPVYSEYQPNLITSESMDWKNVAPLPKGWRTNENNGILNDMNDLEQAKKRNQKIGITDMAISKVPLANVPGLTIKQNKVLQQLHKETLTTALRENHSDEVGLLCNLHTGKKAVVLGNAHSVDIEADINAKILQRNSYAGEIVVTHNHPATSNFSLADIYYFLANDFYGLMSVVTNQGEVYILKKTDKYDYDKAQDIVSDAVRCYNQGEDELMVKCFLANCRRGGVIYVKGK